MTFSKNANHFAFQFSDIFWLLPLSKYLKLLSNGIVVNMSQKTKKMQTMNGQFQYEEMLGMAALQTLWYYFSC